MGTNSETENEFIKKYSSKVHSFYIPIPEFHFFHTASSEEAVDNKFIGREKITQQLKDWLTNKKTKTGVYLVTGFRGMGKSSFVGRVLHQISEKTSKWENNVLKIICFGCCLMVWLVVLDKWNDIISIISNKFKIELNTFNCFIIIFVLGLLLGIIISKHNSLKFGIIKGLKNICFLTIHCFLEIPKLFNNIGKLKKFIKERKRRGVVLLIKVKIHLLKLKIKNIKLQLKTTIENIWKFIKEFKWENEKRRRIPIKLNLGHETLNERDILSLISNSIEYEYKKYISNFSINWFYIYLKWVIISTAASSLSFYILKGFDKYMDGTFYSWATPKWIKFVNNILYGIRAALPIDIFHIVFFILISVLTFVAVYYLWKLAEERIYHKIHPNSSQAIYKRLHELNLRIASSTNEDVSPTGVYSSSVFGLTINQKRNRNYPLASVREIEQQLSWILDEIDESINAPEFIIVFDELDKIDPVSNYDDNRNTDVLPDFENVGSGFTGGATSRKRKQNLLKMLANMKFFISSAKAKFVFIAGRELYDAYLADTSDREFAVGSIFNNVIYVDSFLNSKEISKDVTSMAERFICKQLLSAKDESGKKRKDTDYTLKEYRSALNKVVFPNNEKGRTIQRTIIMLYQFSTYLSYISNGAPKKITNYFEKYVIKEGDFDKKTKTNIVIPEIKKGSATYYLVFKYRDQQKIGFIHYMSFPLINAILNNASRYGDKLLISGCFLINHIYKYHNSGFSWRNLENIPELLNINKSPELREFINTIITFMERSHLSPTISSLYHFKFPMKIAEEISLMSRLSEEISALFNFTLDDSLSLKNHYSKLLKHYTSIQNNQAHNNLHLVVSDNNKRKNDLHHVISGIHHILGDLYMLSEEYNEAIFEYQCCIDILLKEEIDNNDPHSPSHILSLVRIRLKLGLAFEKRQTYNTAYISYNELVSELVKYRKIDPEPLGLEYIQEIEEKSTWKDRKDILYRPNKYSYNKDFEKMVQTKFRKKDDNGKFVTHNPEYEINIVDLIPHLNRQLSSEKNTIISRLSLFEDISLVYQALLARLFILEKEGLSGITKENIDILESDFIYLQRAVYYEDKYMISANFFRKLADILYYKNGLINKQCSQFFMALYLWDYDIENDIYEYCLEHGFEHYTDIKKVLLNMPFTLADRKETVKDSRKTDVNPDKFKDFFVHECKRLKKRMEIEWTLESGILQFKEKEGEEGKKEKKKYDNINSCRERRKKLLCGDEEIKLNNRESLTIKNKRIPCYACKYYNRSLKILMSKMFPRGDNKPYNTEYEKSKAVFFIKKMNKKEVFKTLKNNDLLVLASSLDGMGNALFSCSKRSDYISAEFMKVFMELIDKGETTSLESLPLSSNLEKVLLYFWAAAHYFNSSANMKDAYLCYKKIIHVFVAYLEMSDFQKDKNQTGIDIDKLQREKKKLQREIDKQKQTDIITKIYIRQLETDVNKLQTKIDKLQIKIDKKKLQREKKKLQREKKKLQREIDKQQQTDIITKIYIRQLEIDVNKLQTKIEGILFIKDNVNLTEIRDCIFRRAMQNSYSQYENTNMVEIQELKYIFGKPIEGGIPLNELSIFPDMEELILLFCQMELLCGEFENSANMYKSMPLSKFRIENTISERIVSLRFKANMNMKILYQLLDCEDAIYKAEFPQILYKNYKKYLDGNLSNQLGTDFSKFFNKGDVVNNKKTKIDLIEFLLVDTIFSLSKIVETISPTTKTTLFSESYLGLVYNQLFECNQIFEFIYLMYKWEINSGGKISTKIENFAKDRKGNNPSTILKNSEIALKNIKEKICDVLAQEVNKEREKTGVKKEYAEIFYDKLSKYIDIADLHNNITNYHQDMALKKFRRAIEMHHEGEAYQELISNMYFLEDNLSNNTYQFFFAIERYYNNCGFLDAKINNLESISKVSALLKMKSYI
jgi:hypothetical protein